MTSSSKTIVEVFCELAGLRGRSSDLAEREVRQEISLETLTTIAEGTAVTTGEEFFRALVRHVAGALEVRHAMIAEVTAGWATVKAIAISNSGIPASSAMALNCSTRSSLR